MSRIEELEPGVRRIVAPNPSPMTLTGTCTYLVGHGDVAVIDPGPEDRTHLQALIDALEPGERISHVFVTHAHLDHSPGAAPLAAAVGSRVHAFGPPEAGRSEVMRDLAARGMAGGGEGVHRDFAPDVILADGETIARGDWALRALHTPGHFCNHLCFLWGDIAFTADHVMGWASTLISPPDGDLRDYFRSLAKLEAEAARVFYPGHGAPVHDTAPRIAELAAHRRLRSQQILAELSHQPRTAAELTRAIYTDTPPALLGAAERNVFAHLIEMTQENIVSSLESLSPDSAFERR